MTLKFSPLAAALALAFALPAYAADAADAADAPKIGHLQVTATREAEPVDTVPASITIVTDEEMRARGVRDLTGALALVAGVEITPTGDGGPSGSVPALWGLREFDAFLLVIDGVPAGGAFNPQLTTLSMVNVERIEVMRGAAPVMYGATSFVGVIHVIHYAPGHTPARASASVGSEGSVRGTVASDIGDKQSVALDLEKVGLSDDDADFRRANLFYRARADIAGGSFNFDLNAAAVRQKPVSPVPRTGQVLDPSIPIDANYNPADAQIDENRIQLTGRFSKDFGNTHWDTTLSYARTHNDILRGFLAEDYADEPPTNAEGFAQDRHVTDVYFDTHFTNTYADGSTLTVGMDYLYGGARYENFIYEYNVGLDGSNRPNLSGTEPVDEPAGSDRRNFLGLYAQTDYHLSDRVDLLAGIRFNDTRETMVGEEEDEEGDPQPAIDHRSEKRIGGSLGLSWNVWRDGADSLTLYGDVRDTFKPAALDFGPEAEADILEPETASSVEIGAKGTALGGRLDWDVSGFLMYFDNLVVSQSVNGHPGLVNAGKEEFKGGEFELHYAITGDLDFYGHWAYHDARFGDFVQLFGNTPTQLMGRRLEMSPQHLGGIGLVYAPEGGFQASLVADWVGNRYLNKRNTALARGYTTVDASIGYRFERCELRLAGSNLGDRRDPVAESELGEGQYYRLRGRMLHLGVDCSL